MKTSIIKKAIAGITAALTLGTASAMLAPVSSFAANQTAQEACDTARYYLNNPSKYSHSSSAWCAEFAVDCIEAAGVNMSGLASNSTNALLTNFYNRDHNSYHSRSGSAWRSAYPNPKPVIDTNYTPQPGDLAFVQNYWGDPEPDHTALVVSVSGTGINATVKTIEGNMSGTIKEMTYTNGEFTSKSYNASIYGYATPSYKKTSSVSTLKGDLDLNGKVDITDCSHLSLYLIGDKTLASIAGNEAATKANADMNSDGEVTIVDLSMLKNKISGGSAVVNVNYTKSLSAGTAIYSAAGGNKINTISSTGVYTIVKEQYAGGVKYGALKSGAGWVKL